MNFFVISLFLKVIIERLTKYFFNVLIVLISFFTASFSSVSLINVFFFRCLLLLLLRWELWYLYLNSKICRNDVVFRWHFVILFDKFYDVFKDCEIKHWTYIICFFKSCHFSLSYWTHARSCLMLCLFAIDAFMRDLYFVFITSICIMFLYTMIAFFDIFAHFFNVIIFVTIEALNYFTFSRKYYRVFFIFFLKSFFVMILLISFENSVSTINEKYVFFSRFTFFDHVILMMFRFLWNISFCFSNFSIVSFCFFAFTF